MKKEYKNHVNNSKLERSEVFSPFQRFVMKFEKSRKDVIIELLPMKSKTLVDLACGNGDLLERISSRFKSIYGFDISANRIKTAKKRFLHQKNMIFKAVDLDNGIPLPSNSVDVVICEASFSYFLLPEYVMAEIGRILKRNGIVIIQVPNFAFLPQRIRLLLGKLPMSSHWKSFSDGMNYHFTYQSLKDFLSEYQFEVIDSRNSGLLAPLRRFGASLLAGDIIYKARRNHGQQKK